MVAEGEHCHYGCKECGAPWHAADGACPTDCAAHYKDLPASVSPGKEKTKEKKMKEKSVPVVPASPPGLKMKEREKHASIALFF